MPRPLVVKVTCGADDPERSLILLQVEAGVAVRMACLERVVAA